MPRFGVRTLLITASAVSLLGFVMVTRWETPSYLIWQCLQLALTAATLASFVCTGERRAFFAGVAVFGWLHLAGLLMDESGVLFSVLLVAIDDWVFSRLRNPGPGTLFGAGAIAAIAYGGGCFGRWLYRREHGRETEQAVHQQCARDSPEQPREE